MLYFAYGSNLNKRQMRRRCPAAVALGRYTLKDWRLVFRTVADIIPDAGAKVAGAVWEITAECERSLDAYEGVASGMYRKELIKVETTEGPMDCLVYVMNSTGIAPPPETYLEAIKQGFKDFTIPLKTLREAVERSWDDKHLTHVERQRRRRTGNPRLAPRDSIKAKKTGNAATGTSLQAK